MKIPTLDEIKEFLIECKVFNENHLQCETGMVIAPFLLIMPTESELQICFDLSTPPALAANIAIILNNKYSNTRVYSSYYVDNENVLWGEEAQFAYLRSLQRKLSDENIKKIIDREIYIN